MRILVYAPVHDEPVHDNPLCNKRLQRIARVIKTTWAKGKIGKLEETFSSKRQATRIFVHRKNKSCSLFPTHKQRYPRAYRVISFAVHPPFLRVYIYIYNMHPSIAEIMALSMREKTVIALCCGACARMRNDHPA